MNRFHTPLLRMPLIVGAMLLVALGGASGCSSDDDGKEATPDEGGNVIDCSTETRAEDYAAGMRAQNASGQFAVEILSAAPAPPIKGLNDWTLRITQSGQPYTGALKVSAYMPDHAHSSPRVPDVTRNEDGTFTVKNIYLMMGGFWQVGFAPESASSPPTAPEQAIFPLCVQ